MFSWLLRLFRPAAPPAPAETTPAPAQSPAPAAPAPAAPAIIAPPSDLITPAVLAALSWSRPHVFAPALTAAARTCGVDTPRRACAFLAQLGHESGGGSRLVERWGPTPAQLRYEGRSDLGNVLEGDGFLFRGRGLIQITGRANTTDCHRAIAPHMTFDPDFLVWLTTPTGGSMSAAWFWRTRGCTPLSDNPANFERLTRRINGGLNGLTDRQNRYRAACALFSLDPEL